MRLPSARFIAGLAMVIVVCLVTAVVLVRFTDKGSPVAAATTVTCIGGSEKTELMADANVRRILRDKYQLTVNFTPLGSYDQVQLGTDELKARKTDCLWPSSASGQSVFEAQHRGAFSGYRAENVLQSPEVVFAGPDGTKALLAKGLVQQRDGRYYIVDLKALLLDYVLKKQTWESVGSTLLRGPIAIASTDPAKSNSGFVLAQLELGILATEDAFTAPSLDQARRALPTMRRLYEAQGLQARSSDAGFREWLTQGGELKAGLYAGYESQLVQQYVLAGASKATIAKNVNALYPDPSIYSDHPILALNPSAARFIDAMKDSEIQAIAWKTYGFRSAVQIGANDVAAFADLKLADQVRTVPAPAADVTLALLGCVNDAKTCQ